MTTQEKILLVDDEEAIRRVLRIGLVSKGYTVVEASSGREGLQHAASYLPDLVILDLGLPDIPGIKVLEELRRWSSSAIIILSVQNDDSEKVEALDKGADDYVTKPFSVSELEARIRVSLRHKKRDLPLNQKVKIDDLEIDLDAYTVLKKSKELKLTKIEFELLKLFIINSGKVLTHKVILKEIWGPGHEKDTHYLRIYIGTLRKKIESNPNEPQIILTESGIGYRIAGIR